MTYMPWLNIATLGSCMMNWSEMVVSIRDKRLLERLQLDGDLTLEKAVTCIWQSVRFTSNKFFFMETTQDNSQLMW